jgi:hypothetical protein
MSYSKTSQLMSICRALQLFSVISVLFFPGYVLAQEGRTDVDVSSVQQQLSENQQKWEQSGIGAYQFTVKKNCFCRQGVSQLDC